MAGFSTTFIVSEADGGGGTLTFFKPGPLPSPWYVFCTNTSMALFRLHSNLIFVHADMLIMTEPVFLISGDRDGDRPMTLLI